MSVLLPDQLIGSQDPTHRTRVPYQFSRGQDAVDLATMAGLDLDPWQQDLLIDGLGVIDGHDATGTVPMQKWAAYEVGVELSRQNGKSVVFEARVLAGLFLFHEQKIVYSAHEGETAKNAFERLEQLIKANPELHAEVFKDGRSDGFRRTNGQLSITLWSGQRAIFRTRTAGGGRGLSGDCVILDESQELTDDHVAALTPVMGARPNPQLWYGGSAGTRRSVIQGRLIRRAERNAKRLVFYRWALNDEADPADPRSWARVNPAVGRRMTIEWLESEYDGQSPDKFAHEHLGQGDYPREEGEDWVVPRLIWDRATDATSSMKGPVVFAPAVKWDRTRASIGVAGFRADGRKHHEVISNAPGTHWTIRELVRLTAAHPNYGVVINPHSQANTLVGPLQDEGVNVVLLNAADAALAFGGFFDGFVGPRDLPPDELPPNVHGGGSILTSSLADAQVVGKAGATTWREHTTSDVSPVIAVSNAARGLDMLSKKPDEKPPGESRMEDHAAPARARGTGGYGSAGVDISTVQW